MYQKKENSTFMKMGYMKEALVLELCLENLLSYIIQKDCVLLTVKIIDNSKTSHQLIFTYP